MTPHLNHHLTEEELCNLFDHSASQAEAHPHLLTCARCRTEYQTLRSSIALTQGAFTHLAETQFIPSPRQGTALVGQAPRLLRPALLAAAVLLTLASATLIHPHISRPGHPAAPLATEAVNTADDQALLNDIASDLTATAPEPLQVLTPSTSNSNQSH